MGRPSGRPPRGSGPPPRADGDLEPLGPHEALDWYLEDRRDDLRTATRRKHESALGVFVDWLAETGVENLNDVGGRQLMQFKTWRKTESDLTTVSLNGNLAILRTFLRFCERIDAVEMGLADRVPMPNVPPGEEVREDVPPDEAVEALRSYYRRFEYASRRQAQLELIAEVGIRLGALRAIDLEDVDFEEKTVHLRHRPEGPDEEGTPLKNGRDGERIVNVSGELRDLLDDYVANNRDDVEDRYGRRPLFTTASGRVSSATIRRDFYKLTRPCAYSEPCPEGRDPGECPAAKDSNASDCPVRFSTHPLRKWSIMAQLDAGVPKELLSDRVDVSVPVLDKHYDQRSEERKSKRRREVLESHLGEYTSSANEGDQQET